MSFQPSEATKLAVVVLLAALLARRKAASRDGTPRGLLGPVLLTQVPVALILCEPDLGTALVIEGLMVLMVFAAGLRPRTLVVLALAAMPVLYHLIVGTPFRLRRVLGYIDPWAYRSTVGYQVTEALISIGSGGLLGVGLGDGKQKLFFLPEAHTDFIFAILAEELGLLGVCLLLTAFAVLIWRGLRLAMHAADTFDAYLALGLTSLIAIPAVFNACVATGLLPTKGLPLPFVSYGGSNLVVTLVAVGMLWRIDRDHARPASRQEGKA
jgi:cell division protein FtsW